MQKLALIFLGAVIGAAVGALLAAIVDAGPIGIFLVLAFGLLWAIWGSRIAAEPAGSFLNKLGGLALTPLVAPIILLCVVLVLGASLAILTPIGFVRSHAEEIALRKRMKSKGRYISLHDVRRFLEAGRGSLIAETGMKGASHRVWFTEDDLSADARPLSNDELIALLSGEERPFNSLLMKEYVSEETGKALLTKIPARWENSGRLRRMYPYVCIVQMVRPF